MLGFATGGAGVGMKPVVQEEISGCGIASAAILAGVTYRQARRVATRLGIDAEDTRLWSDTKYVRALLKHYGIRASSKEASFVSWNSLPHAALLAIKWRRESRSRFWHWVVFWRSPQGAVVLDPKAALRSNIRTDFGRMKPKWFIAINMSSMARRRLAR